MLPFDIDVYSLYLKMVQAENNFCKYEICIWYHTLSVAF